MAARKRGEISRSRHQTIVWLSAILMAGVSWSWCRGHVDHLQCDAVRVGEGEQRGRHRLDDDVADFAAPDAASGEVGVPGLEFLTRGDHEREVVESGAVRGERFSRVGLMGVEPEVD